MKYRAEIDGLRALAVLPVIFFHAGFTLFSGGFVGVDVFFVISGFLITSILVDDIESGRFSIMRFYERRFRRILPALTVVLLASMPFAWALMNPGQLRDFGQSVIAASLFVSNILFWREADYFETAAEQKPLLHTWSLAVEEQYYLLFPVFLFLAWRFGRARVFWLIALASCASLALSEYLSRVEPSANFYLAPTRVWELFAGSLAALAVHRHGLRENEGLATLGLAMVVSSMFLFDDKTRFPSLYALWPIIGVTLIVMFAGSRTWAGRLLGRKALVGIGLISYSAYLWHQPIFAFARLVSVEPPSPFVFLALSVLSLLLAWASWKYVEAPFRDRSFLTRRQVLSASIATIAVTSALGAMLLAPFIRDGAGVLNPLDVPIALAEYDPDNERLQRESWDILRGMTGDPDYTVEANFADRDLWFNPDDNRQKVLVVGNSHSKDLFNTLAASEIAREHLQLARFGIQVSDLASSSVFFSSPNYRAADTVIIATRYLDGDIEQLSAAVSKIRRDGKRVALVKNVFEFSEYRDGRWTIADRIAYENRASGAPAARIAASINHAYFAEFGKGYANQPLRANREIDRLASTTPGVIAFDRMDYLCPQAQRRCLAVDERLSKHFYDYGHQTLAGARTSASVIDRIGWLDPLLELSTGQKP